MLTLPLYTNDSTLTELGMMYTSPQVDTRAARLSHGVQGSAGVEVARGNTVDERTSSTSSAEISLRKRDGRV